MAVPAKIPSAFTQRSSVELMRIDKDVKYEYPEGLDLKPGSRLHDNIRDAIISRVTESWNIMSARYADWSQVDQTLTTYIDLDEKENALIDRDPRRPVSIVVPMSYATMETLLTYMVAAFLDPPVFRYDWTGPEDALKVTMLQHVIQKHVSKFKMGLNLHTAWRDGFAYGIGGVTPRWTEVYGKRGRGGVARPRQVVFEGNKLENIDPYLYFPDVSVKSHQVQDGEFVSWFESSNYANLLAREHDSDGELFNVRYLQYIDGRSAFAATDESGRYSKSGITASPNLTGALLSKPVHILLFYINLIPSEWELGDSDVPEKWMFALAGDEVIISAGPIELNHNMFPIAICSPDFDGHNVSPISRMEVDSGMQKVVDFLFNTHVKNVRKVVNDMFVVDPKLVNMNDLLDDDKEGLLLRMRRSAWGLGLMDKAIKQLDVRDVTGNNMSDIAWLMDMESRTSGAVDMMRGIMRSGGERRSATEASVTSRSALSRLAKTARIVSMQMMNDLAYMLASNTQQFMSQEVYIKTVGRLEEELARERGVEGGFRVTVNDLDVDYDIVERDGSLPGGGGDPQTWVQLFQVIASNEAMAREFDVMRLFQHVARALGAKNLDDFRRKPAPPVRAEVRPDEEVLRGIGAGALAPLEEFFGG